MSFSHSRTPRTTGSYNHNSMETFVRVLSETAGVHRPFRAPEGCRAREAQDFKVRVVMKQLKAEGLTYSHGDDYEVIMLDEQGNHYEVTVFSQEKA